MAILSSSLRVLSASLTGAGRWLLGIKYLGAYVTLMCVAFIFYLQYLEYHRLFSFLTSDPLEESLPHYSSPSFWTFFYHYLAPYLKVMGLLGGMIFHLLLVRAGNNVKCLLLPVWAGSLFLATWILLTEVNTHWLNNEAIAIGQPFSLWGYRFKLVALVFVLLSPAIMLTYYHSRMIWEKLLLLQVLRPLLLSIISFCALYLLWDAKENLDDFAAAKFSASQIIDFYLQLLPLVFVECLPLCLVLSVLLALYQMLRWNEIIALLGCGISAARLLLPIIMVAAYTCALSMAANFHWAQQASGRKKILLGKNQSDSLLVKGVLYYNTAENRQWYVKDVPRDLRQNMIRQIQVREFNDAGELQRTVAAAAGRWWPPTEEQPACWSLLQGIETKYHNGVTTSSESFPIDTLGRPCKTYSEWHETPWDIIAHSLSPQYMGVPELLACIQSRGSSMAESIRLEFNTQFWHRLAYPWQGLALVLAIAPLCMQTSRRRSMLAVTVGLVLLCLNLLLNLTGVNLGRSGWLSPYISVWLPHAVTANIGLLLITLQQEAPPLPQVWSLSELRDWCKACWRKIRGRRTHVWKGHSESSDIRRLLSGKEELSDPK